MSFCDDCEEPAIPSAYKVQIMKGFSRAKRSKSEVRVKLDPMKLEVVIRPTSDIELLCQMVEALHHRRPRSIY